ncbi:MAG: zinc dependent phospholipase C family protein [Deltaproteobacteria bacterium]|nr:zinc dependent phospholipase C family protein [Deltaproteobacteria bacterium]
MALVVLLVPGQAFAWGPGTHIDFGLQVLEGLAVLTPALRELLGRHRDDFLYGCCAADIIVGKNLVPYRDHCHNWQVGLKMLDTAQSPAQRALVQGFLTHLCADTIAHNYYVPYKTVESFRTRFARHAYWELRFDQVAHSSEDVWSTLKRIGKRKFREHDAFLGHILGDSSRLFSFRMSQRLFNSFMLLQRLKRWRQANAVVARRSPLPLTTQEVSDCNRLAQEAIFSFLLEGERSRTVRADPTGSRNLRQAKLLRRELRLLRRRGRLDETRWPRFALQLREAFREGIYGKLEIPEVPALPAPPHRRKAAAL